ncbi:unannotated protein [freshwater metagenome]|uniref:histidine kinase n=1 Tax=freshwater metagenome TaxID=449393 RepID=A0A6J7DVK1_9ZZZZ
MSSNQRVKLAQELHDGIAQDLVGLGYQVDSLVGTPNTPPELRSHLRSLRFALSELVEKIRAEILMLRSGDQFLTSKYETSTQFELQRIFGELIRNSQEHSAATTLTVRVSDNGVGGAIEKQGHYGLTGVIERIKSLDGTIVIESNSSGTCVSITIPLEQP